MSNCHIHNALLDSNGLCPVCLFEEAEQAASEKIQSDYELVIVEAQKIKLEKGDTLMVTVKNEYIDSDEIRALSGEFKKAFPDNKIFVFNMGVDGDIKFAVVSEPGKE